MLKTVASFVLASLGRSTYEKEVCLASSLAAAAPDGRFEHPGWNRAGAIAKVAVNE
jgi:hypothetical protein